MKKLWYRTGVKCAGVLLQGIFAGVFVLCMMSLYYWTEGSLSISEMGKSFEQTEVFFSQVEDTVCRKLSYDRNKELFEFNGQFDELHEVDIRQYETGALDEANLNLNTTYYIRDLLEFAQNGALQMEETIQKLLTSGLSEQQIGEQLDSESLQLETVLPISGNTLAEFARMNVNSFSALLDYYQKLCSAARDIERRYKEYEASLENPEGEENSEAPSNISYYIENTNTKQRYTNMGIKSLAAARRIVQNSEELEFLFEGERRFNIMVANSEYVMNDEVAQWFINARFLGSGEKVLLAVNTSYSISDSLQESYQAFERREPVIAGSVIAGILSLVLLLVLLVVSVIAAGRKEPGGELTLTWFDRVPTEIAAGLCLIAAIIWFLFILAVQRQYAFSFYSGWTLLVAALVVEYWIALFSFLSLIRRI